MKGFAIFMTILMFFTGFDLCKEEEAVKCKEEIELAETGKDAQERSDMCSPFCQCARCPFSILIPAASKGFLSLNLGTSISVHTFIGVPIGISLSVWQPPKSV